jgi:hypothetical protein
MGGSMRRMVSFLVVCIVLGGASPALSEHARFSLPVEVADTLPEGVGQIGLFQPLRYGLTDSVELIAHPLLSLVAPAADFKVRWGQWGGWTVSSLSGVSFPTGLVSLLACEGTGCIYPQDAEIPFLIGFKSELLASFSMLEALRGTFRLGGKSAVALGDNTLPSVDLPLAYTRFAHLREHVALWAGLGLDGRIWGPLWFVLDVDGWWVSESDAQFALEQTGTVLWQISEGFALQAGWMLIWGEYPYGDEWRVLPLIDALWAFGPTD